MPTIAMSVSLDPTRLVRVHPCAPRAANSIRSASCAPRRATRSDRVPAALSTASRRLRRLAASSPAPGSLDRRRSRRGDVRPVRESSGKRKRSVKRDRHRTELAQLAMRLHDEQRVAAEVEEVVVDADVLELEHLLPDARRSSASSSLVGRGVALGSIGRAVASGAGSALRSILPLGVCGKRRARRTPTGTMNSGERSRRRAAQRVPRRLGPRRAIDVGDERVGRPACPRARPRRLRDFTASRSEARLDLAELDAVAADLHLVVECDRGTRSRRPARQRARSPVRYSRALGRVAKGSGTKRSAVSSGRS